MPGKRFELNWMYIVSLVLIFLIGLGFTIWGSIRHALSMPVQGYSIIWEWVFVVVINLFCIFCFIALLWKIYCDYHTEITEEAITRPTLSGLRKIKWREVKEVKYFDFARIEIRGLNDRIFITVYAYKDREEVIRELDRLLTSGETKRSEEN